MIVLIDCILVYSINNCDPMGNMRVVLQVLKDHPLFPKYSKCEFLLRSVTFLNHIISSKGIEVDPKKTEAVRNCPRPLSPSEAKIFVGPSRYYRRFVDCFASISSPLTILTQKNMKFEFFETWKEASKFLRIGLPLIRC